MFYIMIIPAPRLFDNFDFQMDPNYDKDRSVRKADGTRELQFQTGLGEE